MFGNTRMFFENLAGIGRLEKGPQDLPSSFTLAVLSVALYAFCKFMEGLFQYITVTGEFRVGMAVLSGAYDTFLVLAIVLGCLAFKRYLGRSMQTLTAICLVGVAISLVIIAFMVLLYFGPYDLLQTGVTRALRFPLILLNLFINGHILREALDIPFAGGLLIGAIYLFALWAVVR
jgi:hypothetical protein